MVFCGRSVKNRLSRWSPHWTTTMFVGYHLVMTNSNSHGKSPFWIGKSTISVGQPWQTVSHNRLNHHDICETYPAERRARRPEPRAAHVAPLRSHEIPDSTHIVRYEIYQPQMIFYQRKCRTPSGWSSLMDCVIGSFSESIFNWLLAVIDLRIPADTCK